MGLKTTSDLPRDNVIGVMCDECDSEFVVKKAFVQQFLDKCPSCGEKMRKVPCDDIFAR